MTARDIVNDYEEMDLYRVIRDYGEDKFAKNIANISWRHAGRSLSNHRGIDRDYQSVHSHESIRRSRDIRQKGTFQAIRIELNRGTGSVERFAGRYD